MARTRDPLLAQWGQYLPCPGSATVETAGGLLLQGAGVVCSPSVLSLLAQGTIQGAGYTDAQALRGASIHLVSWVWKCGWHAVLVGVNWDGNLSKCL